MIISNVIELLHKWWCEVGKQIQTCDLYLFGSAIYQNGELFDTTSSDLDLVTIIPDTIGNAIGRFNWLKILAENKASLELELLRLLKRRDSSNPIVSLIPITRTELYGDIHKSRVRDFFRSNSFIRLPDPVPFVGLAQAGTIPLDNDLIRQVLEFCQEIRNKHLTVSAIADFFPLEWKSSLDPIPKTVMRHAAQVANIALPQVKHDERFDLRVGLDHLTQYIFLKRHDDDLYRQLYNWISLRRGGRGDKQKADTLSHDMHLFLGEILFDLAVTAAKSEPTVISPESEPITATSLPTAFFIGMNGLLQGSKEEQLASFDEATLNMKWRTKPYFSLTLEEVLQIEGKLLGLATPTDPARRRARIDLLDRQRQLLKITDHLINGFQVLIFYQLLLFPSAETRADDIVLALSSYSLLCHDRFSYAASSFGGPLEAYNESLIGGPIPYKVTFGIPDRDLSAFLLESVGSSGLEGIMELAANNQPLLSIRQSLLAVHFVPQLVKEIVNRIDLGQDAIKNDDEHIDCACRLGNWYLGVH